MESLVGQRNADAITLDARHRSDGVDQLGRATVVFLKARTRLFGIAYRILHDTGRAEDIVQDAWVRWQTTDRAAVMNPEAFLVTMATRLALNDAQSARRRRELSAGPSLLQLPAAAGGPEPDAERGEAVEDAMLLLLAKLTPTERAAYVLREAFDYPYGNIADLLGLRPANCRQLVRRAKQSFTSERRRPVSIAAHKRLVQAFVAAAQGGNIADLEDLLVSTAARRPTAGPSSGDYDPAA